MRWKDNIKMDLKKITLQRHELGIGTNILLYASDANKINHVKKY
jgi:hypothetical protein